MSGRASEDSRRCDNDSVDEDESYDDEEEDERDESDERPSNAAVELHPLQHPFDRASASVHTLPAHSLSAAAAATVSVSPAVHSLDTLTFVSQLYQLAVSSIGPHSRPKLIHLNPNSPHVTLTTACSRLFSRASNLPLTHPLSLLLSTSLHSTPQSDGGLYTLALACRLISHAALDSAPPLQLVLHSHQLALSHLLDALSASAGLQCAQPLTRLPAVLRFVRSILQSKPVAQLSADDTDYLSVLIVQAVLSTLSVSADGSSQTAVIRFHNGVGLPVRDSELYKGVVLDLDPPPPLSPAAAVLRRYDDVRVLLYNTSLTFDPSDHHSDLNIETSAAPSLFSASTASSAAAGAASPTPASATSITSLAAQLVDTWQSLGVTAVFCQRVMHPVLRFLCHTASILTVDRLSVRHIHAVQSITAATVQSSLSAPLTAAQLGRCSVEERLVAGRRRLCFESPRTQRPAVTLVLCNHTESALDETRVAVEQAVAALQAAIRDDGQLVVVGGGGVVERQLAAGLRRWLSDRQARVQSAASALSARDEARRRRLQLVERGVSWSVVQVCEMLEDVGRVMGGWEDEDIRRRVEDGDEEREAEAGEWRSVSVQGSEVVSWRMHADELQVDECSVLDSAALKRHALQRAVEIAAVVMRVKQVINAT